MTFCLAFQLIEHFYLLTAVTHTAISMWVRTIGWSVYLLFCAIYTKKWNFELKVPTILHFTALHYVVLLPSFPMCGLKV